MTATTFIGDGCGTAKIHRERKGRPDRLQDGTALTGSQLNKIGKLLPLPRVRENRFSGELRYCAVRFPIRWPIMAKLG